MKVQGSLADVSTKYIPIPDGDYEMIVKEITYSKDGSEVKDDPNFDLVTIKSVVDEVGHPEYGKPVYDRINFKKKDGGENRWAKTQCKKYFEAIQGEERANSDDIDYDELINGRFRGFIKIEEYDDKNKPDGKGGYLKGQSNRLVDILAL